MLYIYKLIKIINKWYLILNISSTNHFSLFYILILIYYPCFILYSRSLSHLHKQINYFSYYHEWRGIEKRILIIDQMVLLITSVIYTRKEVYTIYEALAYSKYLSTVCCAGRKYSGAGRASVDSLDCLMLILWKKIVSDKIWLGFGLFLIEK
jgi:hypothetical protein